MYSSSTVWCIQDDLVQAKGRLISLVRKELRSSHFYVELNIPVVCRTQVVCQFLINDGFDSCFHGQMNACCNVAEFQVVGSLYTHHQKSVIVDSGPIGQRRLSSFIGGLDLTGGRWDTPSHFLFASLQKEHKDDFRNKSWEVSDNYANKFWACSITLD